jgi:hypothetical protein
VNTTVRNLSYIGKEVITPNVTVVSKAAKGQLSRWRSLVILTVFLESQI